MTTKKLMIIRVVCVLLIVAAVGLYIYGFVVKGDSPTDNLARSIVIALSGVSGLIKLAPKRRALSDYAQSCAREQACALDHHDALPWSNMANLLFQVEEYEEAERAAMMALELNPKQYQSSSVMAMLCAVQGRTEEQERYYRMAVEAGQDADALRNAMQIYTSRR